MGRKEGQRVARETDAGGGSGVSLQWSLCPFPAAPRKAKASEGRLAMDLRVVEPKAWRSQPVQKVPYPAVTSQCLSPRPQGI